MIHKYQKSLVINYVRVAFLLGITKGLKAYILTRIRRIKRP